LKFDSRQFGQIEVKPFFGRGQIILIERERIKWQTIANRRLLHQ